MTLVEAVAASTQRYYDFLTEHRAGESNYHITEIKLAGEALLLLENETCWEYHGKLASHLNIPSDSSATLTLNHAPDHEVEIRIREYDRRTGEVQFATKTELAGTEGIVRIDFKWLVKRCLDWYQQRGTSLFTVEEIPVPDSPDVLNVNESNLSEKQRNAIQILLSSSLSYIWGPPGTGKTKSVLAKAVSHCVSEGERVLVLASTNLAVDNALDAVLEEGIGSDRVARIGLPSKAFIEKHPECCEERAFQQEIRQTQSQIKILEDQIDRMEQQKELSAEIQRNEEVLQLSVGRRDKAREQLAGIVAALNDARENCAALQEELSSAEQQSEETDELLGRIDFAGLLHDVSLLEAEQVTALKQISETEQELNGLGFFVRAFTGKKRDLLASLTGLRVHLNSIEETLTGKRKKRDEAQPLVTGLESKKVSLSDAIAADKNRMELLQHELDNLKKEKETLDLEINGLNAKIRLAEAGIATAKQQLNSDGQDYLPEQADELIAEWQQGIKVLTDALRQFQQDLSQKSVLGMTLDGFIGLSLQVRLEIDRVFVDEAPYAPLAKVLPLLSLHRPIGMLGDHKQLSPVCEVENDPVICAYWAKPAVFLEDAFVLTDHYKELKKLKRPQFRFTKRCILTDSYRFGPSLAALLDRHIYNMGLTGLSDDDTSVACVHCAPFDVPGRLNWQNPAEADSVVEALKGWWETAKIQPEVPSMGILTPYKNQAKLLRKKLRASFRGSGLLDYVEVWNTHQSQGREWDYVFFSASDTNNLPNNGPFLADTARTKGKPVVNTTISRAKRHLVIFADVDCWKGRGPSLLTELAQGV